MGRTLESSTVKKLELSFTNGSIISSEGYGSIRLKSERLGRLSLPTGHIVTCDPSCINEYIPFEKRAVPNEYPIDVCYGFYKEGKIENQIVTFMRIRFSDNPVVQWEAAPKKEKKQAESTYQDSRCGCLMDLEIALLLKAEAVKNPDFISTLLPTYTKIYNINNNPKTNVALFSIGSGQTAPEAGPPCYWGLDKDNNPSVLISDVLEFEA